MAGFAVPTCKFTVSNLNGSCVAQLSGVSRDCPVLGNNNAVDDRLSELERRYDECDQVYLDALRAGKDDALLTAAQRAWEAAAAWQAEAYRRFFAEREAKGGTDRLVVDLEIVAEKAEVLTELWADFAAAHAARR